MSTVAAVRAFNRFYTQKIGVLDEGLLHSAYSLPEARVLWELAHRRVATAKELRADLGLDAGYLSRLLAGLEKRGLITRRAARDDKRHVLVGLSARGKRAFHALDVRSAEEIERLLRPLGGDGRRALVSSMRAIESLLDGKPEAQAAWVVRGPRAGDLG
ncbi:MAG TPA: MarR family winged helix-turn-helix transcriptional regulator, partial [Polyangia bacterium]